MEIIIFLLIMFSCFFLFLSTYKVLRALDTPTNKAATYNFWVSPDNHWHMHTLTVDEKGVTKYYIDGILQQESKT